MDQRERRVAAEHDAPVARQPVVERARQRIDGDDRRDADGDAGEENAQPSKPPRRSRSAKRRSAAKREAQARRSCRRRLVARAARAHADDAVAARRERRIVGHQRQRRAALGGQREQQFDDRLARGLVEIAGGLVGDQQRRSRRQRAGQRDALLLAARELGRIMADALREADGGQFRCARARASRAPASSSGAATFSSAVIVGMSWNDWNTMPIRWPRNRASSSSLMRWIGSPSMKISPLSGRSSPAIVISSVDLPEPEGPIRPTASPARDCQADLAQYMDPGGAACRGSGRHRACPRRESSFLFWSVDGGTPHMGAHAGYVQALAAVCLPRACFAGAAAGAHAKTGRARRQPHRRLRRAAGTGLSGSAAEARCGPRAMT